METANQFETSDPNFKPCAILRLMRYDDITRRTAKQILPDTAIDMKGFMDPLNNYGALRTLSLINDEGEWETTRYRVAMIPLGTAFDTINSGKLGPFYVYLIDEALFDLLEPLSPDSITSEMFPR